MRQYITKMGTPRKISKGAMDKLAQVFGKHEQPQPMQMTRDRQPTDAYTDIGNMDPVSLASANITSASVQPARYTHDELRDAGYNPVLAQIRANRRAAVS